MRAEFYCKYDEGQTREIGFYIIPESKTEEDLLELTRKGSNREIFDYNIEFRPGAFRPVLTFEAFLKASDIGIEKPSFEDVAKIGEV
jgi:hypothetical protein